MITIPNWCHCSLTVTGPEQELARFVEAARPQEGLIRSWWKKRRASSFSPEKRPFKTYLAEVRETKPLSFDCLLPQPTDEEYEAADTARKTATCRLCGGMGKRPTSAEEAEAWGVPFYPEAKVLDLPFDERAKCNACDGTGKTFPEGESSSWYEWRIRKWGTKWDASFNGSSMFSIGAETMDPELTRSTRGATTTPHAAIYKFDTAWSPPSPVIEAASQMFPDLVFVLRYGEVGNDYAGEETYQAGICLSCLELEVEDVLAPEELWF